ncbi:MAG: LPP20 family lipoprotein [Bacteriovoracaceae bacterium]|nr:LPP20 family lipoprotein [Bacteriovoracaceae bacterium]
MRPMFLWPVVAILITGCSLFKAKPQLSEHAKELPSWVYSPMDDCIEERELCASGEGKTQSQADANALKSLAAIFETKITASTTSVMTAQGIGAFAQAQESAAVSVRDEVQQTLEAAKIEKKFRYEKLNYSLAVLDKVKASQNLKASIDKVQDELAALWKRKDRTAWAQMWNLFHQREGLNDRYNILMGQRFAHQPSSKDLQDWFQSRVAETPMGLELLDLPEVYANALKSRLTNSGYRLFDVKSGARLKASWVAKKEHLNVEGFEKWFFILSLENISKAGAKVGGLSVQETATGRTREDCQMKVRETLLKNMESRLSELNLQD